MTEQEKLMEQLVNRVAANDHTKFALLKSLEELAGTRAFKKAVSEVARNFRKTADTVFENYLEKKANGIDDFSLIISYKQILNCANFYQEEVSIAKDMIDEYLYYIHSNHLIDTALGIQRPIEDLVDWRENPHNKF